MSMNDYRYSECGLNNVFLQGVVVQEDDHGEEVYSIKNIRGLHTAIVHAIISRRGAMSGSELRFMRSEMGMTQGQLAKVLQCTRGTIGRWERCEETINPSAEVVVKLLCAEKLGVSPDMTVEDMALCSEWRADATEIRIDGSNPGNYQPVREAA